MTNSVNMGSTPPQSYEAPVAPVGAQAPAATSSSAQPASAPVVEKPLTGFVAVVPKSNIEVNLDQVHQNVQDAIGRLNEMLQSNGTGLNFAVDKSIGGPVITVTSSTTGEVIRQIPNEAVLSVAHNIDAIKGLLYNSIA
jgi:flagellar protein FlaG